MSGREFFVRRYQQLGWQFKESELKQSIRINTLNTKETEVVERLESLGVALEKIPLLEHGYWISKSKFSVGATLEYLLGLYSVQEAAAQIPVSLFSNVEGKAVLDACAAPGGKTIQLADMMQNTGAIVALDIEKRRLTALANQLERCRASNTVVYELDARKASWLNMKFDRILLDVPCSGNFASDRGWFMRRTFKDVNRNATLQRQILAEAYRVLSEDGEIVYSTCSLEPEENELNIDWAIRTLSLQVEKINCFGEKALASVFGKKLDSSIQNCKRIWPGLTQGFFVCKLRKRRGSA